MASNESGPPPKRLKQNVLTFNQTTSSETERTAVHVPTLEEASSCTPFPESTTCAAECCINACNKTGLTPFQPKDTSTIERTRKQQGKKSRLFSTSWYSTYTWITLCTRACVFFFYCRYCSGKSFCNLSKKAEDAFITTGFDNRKKAHEKFTQHSQSDIHKESVLKIELLKQESVASLLNKQAMAEQKIRRDMLLKQLSSLKYLLWQGLVIRGHDDMEGNLVQLLMIRSQDCPDMETWIREWKYFSPPIPNEQIALMGCCLLRKLLSEI